ncbi:TolC family outer membrane protein [Rhizobium sp. TRM96647]|uniref:TolC family outer membrane protein n=1 Tax=unclassified Rhizobium TaxID=2613769 RepID=UPI0021E7AA48|nr:MULTISPECIES: TolC family outer membrane protein [unclassified Rhizobium]MCV3737757.1 TolC family outer membrane protein [Rhizobium sp. TRM96647]MCV3759513.1 TolC family outer membrane protein [Rhizobium sp. TRM96650]
MSILRKSALAAVLVPALLATTLPVSAETVAGAMAKAYANNPDLNAARAALRAIDENVTIAKAAMRPQINGVAEANATRRIYDKPISSGLFGPEIKRTDTFTSAFGISVSQQIFDGFQTLNNVRSAEANVLANREALRAQEISILLAAVEAYANIARDQAIVGIRKQNLAFLREQLNASRARLEVGEGTQTDVSLSESQLAEAQALLVSAEAQLKTSEAVYYQIVGDVPKNIKQPGPATRGIPPTLDQAVAIGMREHPTILSAERSVDAAGYNVKAAEGTMLPGVSIQGDVYKSVNGSGSTNDNVEGSISARVTVPIYQGGAEYGQIRQAKERLGQQRILVDSARLEIQQTIISAHTQLEAARAAIQANLAEIEAADMALKGVIEERNVGQRTTLDVLIAQQTVLDAQESLVLSRRVEVVASYSLLASIARLTVRGQNLKVAEYRSEEHYEAVKDKWFGLRTVDGR